MRENDILNDGDEPLAVIGVFVADAVELSSLCQVSPAANAIIGVAIDNILIDILALKMRNGIFGVSPFEPAAGRKPLLKAGTELLTAHALREGDRQAAG